MAITPEAFESRIAALRERLYAQAGRVEALCGTAFEALFALDGEASRGVVDGDDAIDREDVEIEKASVALLTEAAHDAVSLAPRHIREVLMIVKVNNEFERIADAAVSTATGVLRITERGSGQVQIPRTFRVMTNSVLGIIRDTNRAYADGDGRLARLTLDAEDTVTAFKNAILREAEGRIAAGDLSVEAAFFLHEVAGLCERMADHCSNIAEQVLWAVTGTIVRHTDAGWIEVEGLRQQEDEGA